MAFRLAEAYVQFGQRGLSPLSSTLGGLHSRIMGLLNPIKLVTGALATLGTGVGIASMLKMSATIETLTVSLETLTGSAANAKRLMDDINKFAARTPFEQLEIGRAAKVLLAFRVEQEQIIPTLQRIGDMAALSGSSLIELVAIYGKLKSKGRLTMEEMNQLAERGVASMEDFAEVLGVSMAELPKMIAKGQISFEQFEQVMNRLTDEGGRFGGGMEKLAKTSAGLWSTVTGNLKTLLAHFGDAIIAAFNLKDRMGVIGEWLDGFWKAHSATVIAAIRKTADAAMEFIRTLSQSLLPVLKTAWRWGRSLASLLDNRIARGFGKLTVVLIGATGTIWAIRTLIGVVKTLTIAIVATSRAMIALQAFAGPKGWIAIGIGVAALTAGIWALNDALRDTNEQMGIAADHELPGGPGGDIANVNDMAVQALDKTRADLATAQQQLLDRVKSDRDTLGAFITKRTEEGADPLMKRAEAIARELAWAPEADRRSILTRTRAQLKDVFPSPIEEQTRAQQFQMVGVAELADVMQQQAGDRMQERQLAQQKETSRIAKLIYEFMKDTVKPKLGGRSAVLASVWGD